MSAVIGTGFDWFFSKSVALGVNGHYGWREVKDWVHEGLAYASKS
ncbi:MAG: hypothetical protein AAF960_05685 [Bacteroidota bacterium]